VTFIKTSDAVGVKEVIQR